MLDFSTPNGRKAVPGACDFFNILQFSAFLCQEIEKWSAVEDGIFRRLLVQVVRHVSGKPCYVHLKTRTCIWAPPYTVGDDSQLETHSLPGVVRKARLSLPRGCSSDIKRQKHNPPMSLPSHQQQQLSDTGGRHRLGLCADAAHVSERCMSGTTPTTYLPK